MLKKLELLDKLYWMHEEMPVCEDPIMEFRRRREEIEEYVFDFCQTNGVKGEVLDAVRDSLDISSLPPHAVFITDSPDELTKEFNPWRAEKRHDIEVKDMHFPQLKALLDEDEMWCNLPDWNQNEAIGFRLKEGNQAFYTYEISTDTGGLENDRKAYIILFG